jgi:hypothetical protein
MTLLKMSLRAIYLLPLSCKQLILRFNFAFFTAVNPSPMISVPTPGE